MKQILTLFSLVTILALCRGSCWSTITSEVSPAVSALKDLIGGQLLAGSSEVTSTLTTICQGCDLSCNFLEALNTDLQCAGSLVKVFGDASEMLDSWGFNFFADWHFWGDFKDAFNSCEAAFFGANNDFYQLPATDSSDFTDDSNDDSDSDDDATQWMIQNAEQYMQQITYYPREYPVELLTCTSFDGRGGTSVQMSCQFEDLPNWQCAYYSQCATDNDLNIYWYKDTTTANCQQAALIYANGVPNPRMPQLFHGCPILN